MPAESPYILEVHHEDYAESHVADLMIATPGMRLWVDVQLFTSATIRGQVMYNGEPWNDNGRVYWIASDGAVGGFTDIVGRGAYELEKVPPGELRLAVQAPYSLPPCKTATVLVEPGGTYEQDIVYEEELGTISGHVRDAHGKPRATFLITADSRDASGDYLQFSTRTDQDGHYVMDVAAGRRYTVKATSHGRIDLRPDIAVGATGVDFVIPDYVGMLLELRDAHTGALVLPGDTLASLACRSTGDELFQRMVLTGVQRGLLQVRLPEGRVDLDLALCSAGYLPQIVRGIQVSSKGSNEPIVVEWEKGMELQLELGTSARVFVRLNPGHLFFLLDDGWQDKIRGPLPAGSGFATDTIAGKRMWLSSPSLLHRRVTFDELGQALLRVVGRGSYRLLCFPDDPQFLGQRLEVAREDPVVQLDWMPR